MRLGDLGLLHDDELLANLKLISSFNQTAVEYPRDGTTHGQFSIQAARTPDAVAMVDERGERTYQELELASNGVARVLLARGLEREAVVGVMLDDTFWLLVSLLGILKAGGAYLPLDRGSSGERLKYVLRDTRASFVISEEACAARLGESAAVPPGVDVLLFGAASDPNSRRTMRCATDLAGGVGVENGLLIPVDGDSARRVERSSADGLAYVMYTSGTTGRPKGVMILHRAILRLVLNTNYLEPGSAPRILQTGALSFDASTFEIWGALLNGGCLCHPPEHAILDAAELKRLIGRHDATAMWLTAGLFNQLVDTDVEVFKNLRTLLVGGERMSVYHANRLKAALPRLSLVNGYGPTENTTFTCFYPVTEMQHHEVPIGRPIANTQVFILDSRQRLVPVGIAGEICAGGDGLGRGYLNDPALTAEKFIPHPAEPGERLYRTGDWGRWRPDGNIEFLGRKDQQIKIRGYRVEPGEIEARLVEHSAIREAAVLARDPGKETVVLIGYFTGPEGLDGSDLQAYLRGVLPEYMIPRIFVRLEKMPLTRNGKIDRTALPIPGDVQKIARRENAVPRTETERKLLSIWKDILRHETIGMTDDFFSAGGHSLAVTRLVSLIQESFGVTVPLGMIFRPATIQDVADYILDSTRFGVAGIDDAMVPLTGKSDGLRIFAFPPGTGDALGYIQLAGLLQPCAFYAFNFLEDERRLVRYADLITGIDPAGPYLLFGYSAGGNLAFHVARELESRGRRVSDIVMVDSWQYRRKIRFPEGEVDRVAAAFLHDESVAPYLSSAVLRDKAYRIIERYYHYIEQSVDLHQVGANIHMLQSDIRTLTNITDYEESLSSTGWAEVTSGQFKTYPAVGPHRAMLNPPHLEDNAAILNSIFNSIQSQWTMEVSRDHLRA